jgi:hypothetical protein
VWNINDHWSYTMRNTFKQFFSLLTLIISGLAEFAHAFEATGRMTRKGVENIEEDMETERKREREQEELEHETKMKQLRLAASKEAA